MKKVYNADMDAANNDQDEQGYVNDDPAEGTREAGPPNGGGGVAPRPAPKRKFTVQIAGQVFEKRATCAEMRKLQCEANSAIIELRIDGETFQMFPTGL